MPDDLHIATVQKNAREELRVSLTEFKGYKLASLRVFFQADDGTMRPSRSGLVLRIEKLPDLILALQRASMEAKTLWTVESQGGDA